MVASRQSQPLFSSDDTLEIIWSRINEKRLFEARFLWRKLGRELTAEQRTSLEQQLTKALKQVEQLQREARGLAADGACERARECYGRIEAIAIDVPGVSEAIKALDGAEALAARLAKSTTPVQEPVVAAVEPAPAPLAEQTAAGEVVEARSGFFRRTSIEPRFYWLAGLAGAGLCLLIVLLVYWRVGSEPGPPMDASASRDASEKATLSASPPPVVPLPSAPSTPLPLAPKQVGSEPPPENGAQAQSEVPPPAVEKNKGARKKSVPAPPQPSLNLGGLQVQ